MKEEMSFGRRLRQTRIRGGMSQSALEEVSGIPKARLSRYENGHVAPSIHTLERLARALGVSEAALLGDERAILEDFWNVLSGRGVQIESTEQARTLANAVADMYFAMQRAGETLPNDPAGMLSSTGLAPVGEWAERGD